MSLRHRIYTISETLSLIFLVIVAVISLFTIYSKMTTGKGLQILSVVSGSMTPQIPVGSAVFVFPQKEYFVNDVVTYILGENRVTHRIVFSGNYFLTKGDANDSIDSQTVSRSQILGKVGFHIPYLGYLQESTKSFIGLFLFVWLPTVLIVIHESWVVIREFRRVEFSFSFSKASRNPHMIVLLVGVLFTLATPVYAYFTYEHPPIMGTVTTAAFGSPSPSPSGTPSPTVGPTTTPSPSPSVTASPSATPTVLPSAICVNEGSGAGSTNICVINEISETIINQVNNSSVQNNIQVSNTTGGNVSNNNTSNVSVQSGSTVLTIQTSTNTNTNTNTISLSPSPSPIP